MSATQDHHAGQSPSHGGHHADEGGHGSMRDYVIGFVLSVVLTAIPFWLVMTGALADKGLMAIVITLFAAVQIVVHMIYFLHMNAKAEGGWNLLALMFTIMLLVIVLSGSMWVMYHLNHNMMPMTHDMG